MLSKHTDCSGFVDDDGNEFSFSELNNRFMFREEVYSKGYNRLFIASKGGKLYLLKGLKPEFYDRTLYKQLLLKEYDIHRNLSHPNIVPCIGFQMVSELGDCIVMDYVQGQSLRELLHHRTDLSPSQFFFLAKRIAKQLAEAMRYIHSVQVIHRDLKPENIIVTENAANVKVLDFGLSDTDSYVILKKPAGTQRYIAPELLQDDIHADARADIYSYGVILHELFSDYRLKRKSRPYLKLAQSCMLPINERIQSSEDILSIINSIEESKTVKHLSIIVLTFAVAFFFLGMLFWHYYRSSSQYYLNGTHILLSDVESVTQGFSPEDKNRFIVALTEFETSIRPTLRPLIEQTLEQRQRFLSDFTPDSLQHITRTDFRVEEANSFCRRLRDEMPMLGDMSKASAGVFRTKDLTDEQMPQIRRQLVELLTAGQRHDIAYCPEYFRSEGWNLRLFAIYFSDRYLPLLDEQQTQYIIFSLIPDAGRRQQLAEACGGNANEMLLELRSRYSMFSQWDLMEYAWFLTHCFTKMKVK